MPEEKRQILKVICNPYHYDIITQEPYQISATNGLWEFGTDGHCLFAFQVQESDLPTLPAQRSQSIASITKWLESKPSHRITNPQQFAEFLRLSDCANCPMCNGTGKRAIQSMDEAFSDPIDAARYVTIGDHIYNANLLAKVLAFLNLPALKTLPVGVDGHRLTLYGPDWILTPMSVRPDEIENRDSLPGWTDFQAIEPEVN